MAYGPAFGIRPLGPPVSEPISLELAKQHLRVVVDAEDDLITLYLAAAREYCEESTRRRLAPQPLQFVLPGFPCCRLYLPIAPVAALDQISVDYLAADGTEQTLDAASFYTIADPDAPFIVMQGLQQFPRTGARDDAVRVQYVAGYDPTPTALQQAMLLMLGHFERNREAFLAGNIQPNFAVDTLLTQWRNYDERWIRQKIVPGSRTDWSVAPPSGGLTITGLMPSTTVAAAPPISMRVFGSFEEGDTIALDGIEVPTAFVSDTELSALVSSLAQATIAVTVRRGAAESNGLDFLVIAEPAPVSLSPDSLPVNTFGTVPVDVAGYDFLPGDAVLLDGVEVSTSFLDANTLRFSPYTPAAPDILRVQVRRSLGGGVFFYSNPASAPALNVTEAPPAPLVLDSISPTVVTVGTPPFVLSCFGTFAPGDTIRVGGSPVPTAFVSPTELQAIQTDPGGVFTADVDVLRDATPSALLSYDAIAAPAAVSLSPTSATYGTADVLVTVTGTGFVSGDVVVLDGADRATTFVDGTHVTFTMPVAAATAADSRPVQMRRGAVVQPRAGAPAFALTAPGGGLDAILTQALFASAVYSAPAQADEMGIRFTAPAGPNWNVTQLQQLISKGTASGGTVEARIYNGFLGKPQGAAIAISNVINIASLPADSAIGALPLTLFTFPSPTLLNGFSEYCIGVKFTGVTGQASIWWDSGSGTWPAGFFAYEGIGGTFFVSGGKMPPHILRGFTS